jgi:hypothetical protein
VLNKLFNVIVGLALFSVSIFFVVIVAYLVSTEIMPAIEDGSMTIESSVRVLNILWEGNEIYLVLSAYVLLAAGFAFGAFRALAKAIRGR